MLRKIQALAFSTVGRLPAKPSIRVLSGSCGFFGDVFMALNGIRYAERHGLSGCVYWDYRSLYFDPTQGTNAWEFYFESASFDFGGSSRIYRLALPYRPGAEDFVPYDLMSVRASVAAALARYARPRVEIAQEVERFADRHFGGRRVLGVHVRLTDAGRGHEGRKVVRLQHFFDATRDWLDHNPGAKVFLAADDARVVEVFASEFAQQFVSQDCLRSTDGTSLHGHYDRGVPGSPYRKGREVLVDAMLLARCDHLVRTHSRVTCYALCANPSLTYTDLDRLHLGIDRTPWLSGR